MLVRDRHAKRLSEFFAHFPQPLLLLNKIKHLIVVVGWVKRVLMGLQLNKQGCYHVLAT